MPFLSLEQLCQNSEGIPEPNHFVILLILYVKSDVFFSVELSAKCHQAYVEQDNENVSAGRVSAQGSINIFSLTFHVGWIGSYTSDSM